MQITTMHKLTFTTTAIGNEQHNTAMSVIKLGAESLGLDTHVSGLPLDASATPERRTTSVQVTSENMDKLENYWANVSMALALIGVEAVSP